MGSAFLAEAASLLNSPFNISVYIKLPINISFFYWILLYSIIDCVLS